MMTLGKFLHATRLLPDETIVKLDIKRSKIYYFFIHHIIVSNVHESSFHLKLIPNSEKEGCLSLSGFRKLSDNMNMKMMCDNCHIKSFDLEKRWNSIILRDK